MLFNWTMLRYAGEDGVAAVTIIMYVLMFASSLYTGYSYGVAPMISFYDGEKNREKLQKLIKISRCFLQNRWFLFSRDQITRCLIWR